MAALSMAEAKVLGLQFTEAVEKRIAAVAHNTIAYEQHISPAQRQALAAAKEAGDGIAAAEIVTTVVKNSCGPRDDHRHSNDWHCLRDWAPVITNVEPPTGLAQQAPLFTQLLNLRGPSRFQ